MKETVLFDNGFLEFLESEEIFQINGEEKLIKRKMVRRPPGVRAMIINSNNQILLSKEFRYELNLWDYRLPGGKVFDKLKDYKESLKQDNVLENVFEAVKKETKEEVGIQVNNSELFTISKAGAGVVWDLYYFLIQNYDIIQNGQELETDEFVEGFVWKSFDEIIDMCLKGYIHEERTVGVLLRYILGKKQEENKYGM